MSFGFSIGDFLAVIKLAKNVRKDFSGAPRQFHEISSEVRSLAIILEDVEILLSEQEITEIQGKNIRNIADDCQRVLESVKTTLNSYSSLESRGTDTRTIAKRVWKRLTWEPNDIRDLRIQITSHVTLLHSFVEGYTRANVTKLVIRQDQLQHQEILDWLTPIDYAAQQSNFKRQRQAGTGLWLLNSPEYQQWVMTKGKTLFCPGLPGAGKTILTSIVVDSLFETFRGDSSVAICYFFYDYRRKEEQRLDDNMLSILKQLAQNLPVIHQGVRDLYNQCIEKRTRPSTDEVRKTLCSVANSYSRTFVVIDALDECQHVDGCRAKFISELLNLQTTAEMNMMATSRLIPEITERFSESICMEIRARPEDINIYLDGSLPYLPGFVSDSPSLQSEIKQSIIECVDGMFLLAQLHLDSLRGKRSPKAIRNALAKLTKGSDSYDVAYHNAMQRIQGQLPDQIELAMQTLTTKELQHALAVELDDEEFDSDNLPDIRDLVSNCCGLVTIDSENDVIRLVHYTTQEYFERTQKTWFPNAQSEIASICTTYLSFQHFESGMCASHSEFEDRLSSYPLYDYASHHWGSHAAHAPSGTSYQYDAAFLKTQSKIDAACQGLLAKKYFPLDTGYSQRSPRQMTALHLAAFWGLREMAIRHLDDRNLDASNSYCQTPLSFAAKYGHTAVTQLLLEKGANVESRDWYGRTPLLEAANVGHTAVVQLLLEKGANIESRDMCSITPLSQAAQFGHTAVVQLLLEKGADTESYDHYARKSLSYAAEDGHEAVVRLLLENGADIESYDGENTSALSYAAQNLHEAVVQLLLEKGADIESKDEYGKTPLLYTAVDGNEDGAKLLLQKGADINSKDKKGRTPLSHAAEHATGITQVLLTKQANVEIEDNLGRSPVFYAIIGGHTEALDLLLAHGQTTINFNASDYYGTTALSVAVRLGHTDMVKRLLTVSSADSGATDNFGRTLLWWARRQRHADITECLLEHARCKGANISVANLPERSPVYFGEERLLCDICFAALSYIHYSCSYCNEGDFFICSECHELGARCLIESHELRYEEGESS